MRGSQKIDREIAMQKLVWLESQYRETNHSMSHTIHLLLSSPIQGVERIACGNQLGAIFRPFRHALFLMLLSFYLSLPRGLAGNSRFSCLDSILRLLLTTIGGFEPFPIFLFLFRFMIYYTIFGYRMNSPKLLRGLFMRLFCNLGRR